jgi:glycosyltransferase involved in cell wall biosynthesis
MRRPRRSVGGQTLRPERLESIVVANGCRDATAAVVRAWMACHPDLAVTLLEDPRPGVARAKNLGAAAARAPHLLFLDADSRAEPALAARILARAGAGERAASIRIVADSDDLLDRGFFTLIDRGKGLFGIRANMLWCERDLFLETGGFDERLQHAEDVELLRRLRRRGVTVGHVAESAIATSTRRLRRWPLRLGMVTTLGRWALGHAGLARRWPY